MTTHLEEQLQRDIDLIRDKVREMADLALRGLEDAVKALTTCDTKLAYGAIVRDSRIDDLESVIDGMCVDFMVRHIPVAAQLRFAHSVGKIISEIERVGDYAESINRQAILLCRTEYTPDLSKYAALARVAIEMTRQAVRSFLDEDVELASTTMALDARANKLHQVIYRDLRDANPQGPEHLSTLFALLTVANRFERVADQANNICQEVFYIVTGQVVKHHLHHDIQVLFVSSANSCRSLMAEGIARTIAGHHFDFFSAGVDVEQADPGAVEFLASKGIDVSAHEPSTLEEIGDLGRFKAVVAIGKQAAEAITRVGYKTIVLEWNVDNPAGRPGEDAAALQVRYGAVFDDLVARITELIRGLHGTTASLQAGDKRDD